jgi:uncharacterized repeat protein (TIGR01451 family)
MLPGCRARWALFPSLFLLMLLLIPQSAHAEGQRDFDPGSLIIPMDNAYQDWAILNAFGLVDTLLRQGVPVWWCINPNKVYGTSGDIDFTADVHDLGTSGSLAVDYRGGPFVVDVGDTSRAMPIVNRWQVAHPDNPGFPGHTHVHVLDVPLVGTNYWQVLTASPRIAVIASAKQSTVFNYLNAAGIPDENGLAWSSSSADVITPTAVDNGALIDATGAALYNGLLMTDYDAPTEGPAITAFLNDPVLLFAEDLAAIQIESVSGGGAALDLLTTNGMTADSPPSGVQYGASTFSPFFQMDASGSTIGFPDPTGNYFTLSGGAFFDPTVEMLRGGASSGQKDVWLAGFVKGTCTEQQLGSCPNSGPKGRVAYLGGYYTTTLPISSHPLTLGTRLFLDALFAGTCTITEAQPAIAVGVTGPTMVTTPSITVTVALSNTAHVTASNVTLSYPLPAGAQFVSATNGGVDSSGVVTWFFPKLGNSSGGGDVTMTFPGVGSYSSTASARYKAGNTPGFTAQSNTLQTMFSCPNPGLVALWPAEGNADDVTGNGHNGTLQNGATFAPGKVGTAFSLDGGNDNISVPDDPAFHFTNAMSIEGWINTTASTDRYIATKHEDSFYFAVGGGAVAPHMLSFWLNGVSSSWFTGSTPVDDGQWHHVAATYDGSTMSLYVDGHLDASAPRAGTIQQGTSGVLIGARSDGTNASNFPGMIDELALYNRAIGPAEVQALDALDAPCAAVSVGDAPTATRTLELSPPWPNPATQIMSFEFRTPGEAAAHAEIVDVAGRRVSQPLKEQLLPGGAHRFQWDGRDASGARVAAGVYLIRVTSGTATAVQRIVLVR